MAPNPSPLEPFTGRAAYILSVALGALMAVQSLLGLIFQEQYRDVAWIRAAWFGNDLVTLLLATPLLFWGVWGARSGSMVGLLIWLGMLGYGMYNYAFYLLGAALNVFFPLYTLLVVLLTVTLILVLAGVHVPSVSASFRGTTRAGVAGAYYVFTAAGLATIWIAHWAAYVFAGDPTPVEPEIFKLVAALDSTVMVPALGCGGILLWLRHRWGYIVAPVAGIQASLYLLVLSASSIVAVRRGLREAPGELPLWGTLFLSTTAVTSLLLAGARRHSAS